MTKFASGTLILTLENGNLIKKYCLTVIGLETQTSV